LIFPTALQGSICLFTAFSLQSCVYSRQPTGGATILLWSVVLTSPIVKGPYHPFCMFEPDIFNFHTRNVTDNLKNQCFAC
ncbi:hypothetical protein LDENG_00214610, partial [Lucifuga dentata]